MKTADFDFDLPSELIAQAPLAERANSRMMVVDRRNGVVTHHHVRDLPEFLEPHDLLVVNNTRVMPMRTYGKKVASGGRVEVLFLEQQDDEHWLALIGASRFPSVGSQLSLLDGRLLVRVVERLEKGQVRLSVENNAPVTSLLHQYGLMPLPPYIRRSSSRAAGVVEDECSESDRSRYQTVYAEVDGAAAAPTAGLHLTQAVFDELASRGVLRTAVTLHVGMGTFQSVDVENVADHHMHSETYSVSSESAAAALRCRERGGRVVAVGSTSVKSLETMFREAGGFSEASGRSEIYIYPPYDFKAVDVILTNFHLPKSTLLMMMAAFAGHDLIMDAYRAAIAEEYRFFSYGDCMLIL